MWERTHRVAGWLFVGAGLAGVVTNFVPLLRLWGLVVAIMLASFIPVIYSYYAYRRSTVDGREPLSPPFDSGEQG